MTMDIVYTGEFFQNLHGGLNTHEAGEYRGLIDQAGFVDEKEISIETFYKYQALPWLTFKPDAQCI